MPSSGIYGQRKNARGARRACRASPRHGDRPRPEGHGAGDLGFSLIEVVFAVAILTVGVVGTIAASSIALIGQTSARYRSMASQDLAAAVEMITNEAYPDLVAQRDFLQDSDIARFTNLHMPGEHVHVLFTSLATNPVTATVTIWWSEYNPQTKTTSASVTFTATVVRTSEN